MNIHIYGDICDEIKQRCFKSHGGKKFLGFIFLSDAAKKEYKRIIKLPFGEILAYIK